MNKDFKQKAAKIVSAASLTVSSIVPTGMVLANEDSHYEEIKSDSGAILELVNKEQELDINKVSEKDLLEMVEGKGFKDEPKITVAIKDSNNKDIKEIKEVGKYELTFTALNDEEEVKTIVSVEVKEYEVEFTFEEKVFELGEDISKVKISDIISAKYKGEDVSDKITADKTLTTSTEGKQDIVYSVEINGDKHDKVLTHRVVSSKGEPKITIKDIEPIKNTETFDPLSAIKAVNNSGKDISDKISTVSSKFNEDTYALDVEYKVDYYKKDDKGNYNKATKEIKQSFDVFNKFKPEVKYTGPKTIEAGMKDFDIKKHLEVVDSEGNNLIDSVQVVKDVQTDKIGEQTVTLKIKDINDKEYTHKINVEVKDTQGPEIHIERDSFKIQGSKDKKFDYFKYIKVEDAFDGVLYDEANKINIIKPTFEGEVNLSELGEYEVIYKVKDKSGNETVKKVTYTVVDEESPIIEGQGQTLKLKSEFDPLKGIKAYSPFEGDLTDNIEVIGAEKVDTSTPGEYEVTYKVKASNGKETSKTLTHVVEADTVKPEFTIEEGKKTTFEWTGDSIEIDFLDKVKAIDDVDGDVSDDIEVSGEVDTTKLGNYDVTYKVKDSSGNEATKVITYKIVDTTPPTLEIENQGMITIGSSKTSIDNSVFGKITAIDNHDGDISDKVYIDKSNVKFGKPGEYAINITATDKSGNAMTKIVQVKIFDNRPPTWIKNPQPVIIGTKFDYFKDVKAIDVEEGDVSDRIKVVSGEVDTSKPGKYTVKYEVSDTAGNKSTTEVIYTVVENTKPYITGPTSVELAQGSSIDLMNIGVKAYDKEDELLGEDTKLEIINLDEINLNKVGNYKVKYQATDSFGLKSDIYVLDLKVYDATPPEEVKYVYVTFDSNGGSGVGAQKIIKGKPATRPATPTRDGYKFLGWYLGSTPFDFNTKVNSDIKLTAKWEKIDSGGGTIDPPVEGQEKHDLSVSIREHNITEGGTVRLFDSVVYTYTDTNGNTRIYRGLEARNLVNLTINGGTEVSTGVWKFDKAGKYSGTYKVGNITIPFTVNVKAKDDGGGTIDPPTIEESYTLTTSRDTIVGNEGDAFALFNGVQVVHKKKNGSTLIYNDLKARDIVKFSVDGGEEISTGSWQFNKRGTYTATFEVGGVTKTITIKIGPKKVDMTQVPIITLTSNKHNVFRGETVNLRDRIVSVQSQLKDVSTKDVIITDSNGNVVSEFGATAVGAYKFFYKVTDSVGRESNIEVLTVNVLEPGVTEGGKPSLIVGAGKNNVLRTIKGKPLNLKAEASAMDADGNNISDDIEVIGNVDWNKEGRYPVTFKVTDAKGRTTTLKIDVLVQSEKQYYEDNLKEKAKDGVIHQTSDLRVQGSRLIPQIVGLSAVSAITLLSLPKKRRKKEIIDADIEDIE